MHPKPHTPAIQIPLTDAALTCVPSARSTETREAFHAGHIAPMIPAAVEPIIARTIPVHDTESPAGNISR